MGRQVVRKSEQKAQLGEAERQEHLKQFALD